MAFDAGAGVVSVAAGGEDGCSVGADSSSEDGEDSEEVVMGSAVRGSAVRGLRRKNLLQTLHAKGFGPHTADGVDGCGCT